MTADLHTDEEYGALHEYSGIPNKPEKQEEKGRWRRFLGWALPWLKRKQILAEALLARIIHDGSVDVKIGAFVKSNPAN